MHLSWHHVRQWRGIVHSEYGGGMGQTVNRSEIGRLIRARHGRPEAAGGEWAFAEPDAARLRRTPRSWSVRPGARSAARRTGFSTATPMPGWSMTDSTAVLIGTLGRQASSRSAEGAVAEWRGAGDRVPEITLDQLLRMTSGLHFQSVTAIRGASRADVVRARRWCWVRDRQTARRWREPVGNTPAVPATVISRGDAPCRSGTEQDVR